MSNKEWVAKQWQGAELGDERLTKRAIKIGEACLTTPDGSLPQKFGSWGDMKGAYRFLFRTFFWPLYRTLRSIYKYNIKFQIAF